MNTKEQALIQLGQLLKSKAYRFITLTPASHFRFLEKSGELSEDASEHDPLRFLFGWNIALRKEQIPPKVFELLSSAEMLIPVGERFKSGVRFSTFENFIFIHSDYPTNDENSVFFGPDTYRFLRFLKLHTLKAHSILDIGCGTGVGGIFMSAYNRRNSTHSPHLVLNDINEKALYFSEINCELNGIPKPGLSHKNLLKEHRGVEVDLIISNPPFIIDPLNRSYRNGGEKWGMDLSIQVVQASLDILKPGGHLLLYTASAFLGGRDVFYSEIAPLLSERTSHFTYEEIDPDIFGEELSHEIYGNVERLAAVGLSCVAK